MVSAYVQDSVGNTTALTTQAFTAEAARTITRVSADPTDPSQAQGSAPSLSGDGSLLAFTASGAGFDEFAIGGPSAGTFAAGVYIANLSTGAAPTLIAAGGADDALSSDGSALAYTADAQGTFDDEIYVQDLATPTAAPLLVTANAAGAADGFKASAPSLSANGAEIVFASDSNDIGGLTGGAVNYDDKIFLADIEGGKVTDVRLIAGDGTGSSLDPHISADGSVVVFESNATDLAPGANSGAEQIYAEALTGPDAGVITLVSGTVTAGSPANSGAYEPSISADGRYVVFDSSATNLDPGNLAAGVTLTGVSQIYLKDLQTGALTLVSASAAGAPGQGYSFTPTISGDGTTVSFSSSANNLGPVNPNQNQEVFVKSLTTGTMSLVSEPGGVPGAGSSSNAILSGDGRTIAFESSASNLVAGQTLPGSQIYVTDTAPVGSAEEGYIVGGTVAYANGSGGTALTGDDGQFSLSGGTGSLVLTGGVDSATGLTFTGEFTGPAGSTVLSPLTTLIETVVATTSDTVAAADAAVVAALGLAPGTDLTTLDAVSGTQAGDPTSTAAFEAASELYDVVSLIAAAGGSTSGALDAFAADIATGDALDLTDPTTLAAAASAANLDPTAANAIASMVAATAAQLAAQLGSPTTPETLFIDVTGASIALQGDAAAAIAAATHSGGSLSDVADAFTSNLADVFSTSDATAARNTEAACYRRGTRIATPAGEVAIEALCIGDLVLTATGATRPVVWLGHRNIDTTRHPRPGAVWPVVVRANAFASGLPRRDLWLSPGHNVVSEERLMPVGALVNGVSVQQVRAPHVEYWHVELDVHDVILAEGLPAESYLDTGNRTAFANSGAFIEAHPDFAPMHWADTCLPLVLAGPEIAATKQRLLARLAGRGHRVDQVADAHIVVDEVRVEPIPLCETRLAFVLPAGGSDIELRSNLFVPAHTVAESADLRELGLCVGRLQIDGADLPLDDDANCTTGWHEAEFADGPFSHRWTTGAMPLPLGARIVLVELVGVGYYWSVSEGLLAAHA